MYEYGKGVKQDYTEAILWYEKAAEQDDVTSQLSLALFYKFGKGVQKDYTQMFYWYKKAAELGDTGAQVKSGIYVPIWQGP